MTRRKVLVCDDDGRRVLDWAKRLHEMPEVADRFNVEPLPPADFAAAYAALKERRQRRRSGQAPGDQLDKAAVLDNVAALLVDFDLTPDRTARTGRPEDAEGDEAVESELNGEFGDTFAYLARCYSTAGYIVVVNQRYQESTFDLTMALFALSPADLNVAATDLQRTELWLGRSAPPDARRFRPSHWPRLLDAPGRLEELIGQADLDAPVLAALGLDGDIQGAFTQDQLDPLGDNPYEATYRDVATNSAFGLLPKDVQDDPEVLKRIAAAGVQRWLERVVLPSQNVLVDAPHLAQRHPGLVLHSPDEQSWDALADLAVDPADAGLDTAALAPAVLPACGWLSRPVWSWPAASAIAAGARRATADSVKVFCEDVSAFVPLLEATEFVSSVPGAYRQRFVYELDDEEEDSVDYRPSGRLYID